MSKKIQVISYKMIVRQCFYLIIIYASVCMNTCLLTPSPPRFYLKTHNDGFILCTIHCWKYNARAVNVYMNQLPEDFRFQVHRNRGQSIFNIMIGHHKECSATNKTATYIYKNKPLHNHQANSLYFWLLQTFLPGQSRQSVQNLMQLEHTIYSVYVQWFKPTV